MRSSFQLPRHSPIGVGGEFKVRGAFILKPPPFDPSSSPFTEFLLRIGAPSPSRKGRPESPPSPFGHSPRYTWAMYLETPAASTVLLLYCSPALGRSPRLPRQLPIRARLPGAPSCPSQRRKSFSGQRLSCPFPVLAPGRLPNPLPVPLLLSATSCTSMTYDLSTARSGIPRFPRFLLPQEAGFDTFSTELSTAVPELPAALGRANPDDGGSRDRLNRQGSLNR